MRKKKKKRSQKNSAKLYSLSWQPVRKKDVCLNSFSKTDLKNNIDQKTKLDQKEE